MLFNIDIEKLHQGEYWTNRYQVSTAAIGDARTLAQDFVAAERAVHTNVVLFTKVRTSDNNPATDSYFSDPINLYGEADVVGDLLPHFNRVRVDFQTADGGRPCRKYLLLPIQEFGQVNGEVTSQLRSFVQNSYVIPILTIGEYCDPDESPIVAGSVFPRVAMRQMRRASKRKNPVI